MLDFEARLRVIYGDTDQMGVVYYANYFRFFEAARNEYLRARGATYRELEREGLMLPVVEATCHYRSSARYDDLLIIRTGVTEVKRVTLTFEYEVLREGDLAVLCTGRTVHASVSREGKPMRLPQAVLQLLGAAKGGSERGAEGGRGSKTGAEMGSQTGSEPASKNTN